MADDKLKQDTVKDIAFNKSSRRARDPLAKVLASNDSASLLQELREQCTRNKLFYTTDKGHSSFEVLNKPCGSKCSFNDKQDEGNNQLKTQKTQSCGKNDDHKFNARFRSVYHADEQSLKQLALAHAQVTINDKSRRISMEKGAICGVNQEGLQRTAVNVHYGHAHAQSLKPTSNDHKTAKTLNSLQINPFRKKSTVLTKTCKPGKLQPLKPAGDSCDVRKSPTEKNSGAKIEKKCSKTKSNALSMYMSSSSGCNMQRKSNHKSLQSGVNSAPKSYLSRIAKKKDKNSDNKNSDSTKPSQTIKQKSPSSIEIEMIPVEQTATFGRKPPHTLPPLSDEYRNLVRNMVVKTLANYITHLVSDKLHLSDNTFNGGKTE